MSTCTSFLDPSTRLRLQHRAGPDNPRAPRARAEHQILGGLRSSAPSARGWMDGWSAKCRVLGVLSEELESLGLDGSVLMALGWFRMGQLMYCLFTVSVPVLFKTPHSLEAMVHSTARL